MIPEKLSLNDFTNYLGQLGVLKTSYPVGYFNKQEKVPKLCIKNSKGDEYFDGIISETVSLDNDQDSLSDAIEAIFPNISHMQYTRLMKLSESYNHYYYNDPYSEESSLYEETFISIEKLYDFLINEKYIQPSDIDLYRQKENGLTFEKLMAVLNNTMEISKDFSKGKNKHKYFHITHSEDGKIHMLPGEYQNNDNTIFFNELKKLGFPVKQYNGEEYYNLLYFSEPSFSFCSSSLSDAQYNKTNYYSNNPRIFEPKVLYAFILNSCNFPFPEIEPNTPQRVKKPDTLTL